MNDAYRPPSNRVLDKARAGIEAVQSALRAAGRESWYVYALRSWEVHPRAHLLYAITRHTSVPLTRSLAHALEGGATWVSGTLESQILSVDLCASGDPAEPITALEIVLVVWPWGDRKPGVAWVVQRVPGGSGWVKSNTHWRSLSQRPLPCAAGPRR